MEETTGPGPRTGSPGPTQLLASSGARPGADEGQRSTMAVGLGRLNVAAVTRRLVCRHHADLHPTCGLLPAPGPVGAAALATEDRGESPDDPPPVASWP